MLFREVINLISIAHSTSALGDPIETPTTRQVFADKQSIRQSEFYQAMATGLRPEIMFVVRTVEYQDERQLSWGGKTYNIIRTYSKDDEQTELICSGVVNTNG